MSNARTTNNTGTCGYWHEIDIELRRRVGISVRVYRILKFILQMLGAAAGVYAMWLGADPLAAFTLIALIVSGPEAFETFLTNTE